MRLLAGIASSYSSFRKYYYFLKTECQHICQVLNQIIKTFNIRVEILGKLLYAGRRLKKFRNGGLRKLLMRLRDA